MSKEARGWAALQRVDDRTLRLVLDALAWSADRGTGEVRAAQAVIAAKAGVRERAARSALAVLERLEIVTRKARSKGKYGRTTDLVTLSMDRRFDVSRAVVRAVRQSLQPAARAGNSKSCNRHRVPLQPAPRAGDSYLVDQEEPYQEEESTKVEGLVQGRDPYPHDRDHPLPTNVIPLLRRGAA